MTHVIDSGVLLARAIARTDLAIAAAEADAPDAADLVRRALNVERTVRRIHTERTLETATSALLEALK